MARIFSVRTLLFGGLAAGAAYALRNNETVKGLLGGGGGSAPEPYAAPSSAPVGTPAVARDEPMPPPPVANVDVAGPPANTSTHVPAPEPFVHEPTGGIDELAEEEAAAAEAANIGGIPEAYPSEDDASRPIDEALRPLEEAGEGYSEGQELAEADLIENVEPAAGDPIEGGRAIDDVIEAQDDPFSGESEEATLQMGIDDAPPPSGSPVVDLPPPEDAPDAAAITPSGTAMPEESTVGGESTTSAEEKSAAVWKIDDTVEQDAVADEDTRPQDGSS